MQKVTSYQTDDGRLFTDRAQATTHEFDLAIRGFLQSKNHLGNTSAITVAQVAQTISKNMGDFDKIVLSFKRKMAAMSPRKAKEENRVLQVA